VGLKVNIRRAVMVITSPVWGCIRVGLCTKINRKDFGLVWNAALETGGVAVGEEITITLEIEMIKK
jgi:polyisoprenoid-binding protein YceI